MAGALIATVGASYFAFSHSVTCACYIIRHRLARGDYSAKIRLVDDDGKVHLDLEYLLEIAKDY